MTLDGLAGPAAYAVILVSSAVEGEVVFVAASVLVGVGRLSPVPVVICGALGAAAGDQFFYYAARGWLGRLSRRFSPGHPRRDALLRRVRKYGAWMGFACRFLPGIRIAIATACALGEVPAPTFSAANLVGSFTWATLLMAFVAWGGPAWCSRLGLPHWAVWAIPPFLVLILLGWISRTEQLMTGSLPDRR